MITDTDTRVIDPEFAFFGPMGFDIGAFLANLFLAYFAQEGHDNGQDYTTWISEQIEKTWQIFAAEFEILWAARGDGELCNERLYADSAAFKNAALKATLEDIFEDTLGFAGCKMIRRILGLAHVEDFEVIEDLDVRAACERKALEFGRRLIIGRTKFKTIKDVTGALQ